MQLFAEQVTEQPVKKNISISDEQIPAKSADEKKAPVHPETPQPFQLIPHQAVYEIKFQSSQDPNIKDITGTSTVDIIKTKDGWSYKQELNIQLFYFDGTVTTLGKEVATWESSAEFSFYIENSCDGAPRLTLSGRSIRNEQGNWHIYFEEPKIDGFIIDQPLLFPLGYLEKILQTIKEKTHKNQKIVLSNQLVYDPTDEAIDDESSENYDTNDDDHQASPKPLPPIRINTFITPARSFEKIRINNQQYCVWRLQQALYKLQSSDLEPSRENTIELTENGVVTSMKTIWNDNTEIMLSLKSLTIYQ